MIRDLSKVYGEVNDPDTVLSESNLTSNKYIVSKDSKRVEAYTPGTKRILATDENGKLFSVSYNNPNLFVGTDENGKLTVYEGGIPSVPPVGRELILEVIGNPYSMDALKQATQSITTPGWYELDIAGAGGGGGGSSWRSGAHVDGANGAAGGYYKSIFMVDKNTTSSLQYAVGTPGQGGAGPYHELYKGAKQSRGNCPGGQGGKSPTVYEGTGGDAPLTRTIGTLLSTEAGGPGLGINGGADGGGRYQAASGPDNTYYKAAPTAGGGGANGPQGGKGATVTYWSTAVLGGAGNDTNVTIGGSGGAGGGLGLAGYGANSPTVSADYKYGGQGQGGGGGGQGTQAFGTAKTGYDNTGATAGAGGGGGGASRVLLSNIKLGKYEPTQTLEIIAGGGGGGAGASSRTTTSGWQDNDGVIPADAGGNNIDSVKGGGGNGGLVSTTLGTATTSEVRGGTGEPGYIRLWRRY
jgi:hypothetical protein